MSIMDRITGNSVEQQQWIALPCEHALAFGVPLFRYTDADGHLVETAVTPLSMPGEICPHERAAFAGVLKRPNIAELVSGALDGAPHAIIGSVRAHLTHKRLLAPGATSDTHVVLEPEAGIYRGDANDTPAVLVGMGRDQMGVLAVERLERGAVLRVRWIEPGRFVASRSAFAEACAGLSHEDLLAGMHGQTEMLAIMGIEQLLKIGEREIPNAITAALIVKLVADLPAAHPARERGMRLLDVIATVEGGNAIDRYSTLGADLARMRQLLALVASKRKKGKEDLFEVVVAQDAWLALYAELVEASAAVCGVLTGSSVSVLMMDEAMRRVARTADDGYTRLMRTEQGRLISALGGLATHPSGQNRGEQELDAAFRGMAALLGEGPAMVRAPYSHGVLSLVMGGW